jgi:hypothetical protein
MSKLTDKDLLQSTLEDLFDKHQLIPRIKQEMQNIAQFTEVMEQHNIDPKFGIDLLTHMAIQRRCKINVLVGILRHHYQDSQRTADEICKCADADLVDFDPRIGLLITIAQVSSELQIEIDKYQYPLPMVVAPEVIKDNDHNGYRINKFGSVILKDNQTDDDVCLDHLNRCNAMALTINQEVMTMVRNQWKNLDKPKDGESLEEYRKRVKAFEKYDRTSRDVMKLLLSEGNELYLTHKYDKRGRTYCQGYQVTYQGNAWNKAVVEFSNKELI